MPRKLRIRLKVELHPLGKARVTPEAPQALEEVILGCLNLSNPLHGLKAPRTCQKDTLPGDALTRATRSGLTRLKNRNKLGEENDKKKPRCKSTVSSVPASDLSVMTHPACKIDLLQSSDYFVLTLILALRLVVPLSPRVQGHFYRSMGR